MFIDIRAGMCYTIANKDGMTVKNQSLIRQTGEWEKIMKPETRKTARELSILEKLTALERDILKIDGIVYDDTADGVDFDINGFRDGLYQVILIPKYNLSVMPDIGADYMRRSVLIQHIKLNCLYHGLETSGDRIEDYGEHLYIVRNCKENWYNGKDEKIMGVVRFYINLYKEIYNVPSNMDDFIDRCMEAEQGRDMVHDFITDEIRRDFTQSALEEHAQENPGSVLNTLDEIDHDSLMEDLYGGTK